MEKGLAFRRDFRVEERAGVQQGESGGGRDEQQDGGVGGVNAVGDAERRGEAAEGVEENVAGESLRKQGGGEGGGGGGGGEGEVGGPCASAEQDAEGRRQQR